MRIRAVTADDAQAVSRLRRETYSYSVMSPATIRHMITVQAPGERFAALVAENGGQMVGWGSAGLNVWTSEPGWSSLSIYVHPEHRRQGVGGGLAGRLHDHLREVGATRVRTFATPAGLEFATGRGYEPSREMHYSGVDPRVLPDQPPTPEGIRVVPIDTLEPRQLYLADTTASLDEPGDSPMDAVSFEDWVAEVWESPGPDRSLGVAAMAGDEVVSFASIERDGDRAWSGMTGTVPGYRGRGLAKLVKSVALRRCAAAGVVGAFTSNDDANGPMLAINDWLGYRRIETQTALLLNL